MVTLIGRSVRVKICGITGIGDAVAAVDSGADALGFVFCPSSRRRILPRQARAICALLPRRILRVGVFVDGQPADVRQVAAGCGLDVLQFHGDETPAYCRGFEGYRIVKALRVRSRPDLSQADAYRVDGLLFDTLSPEGRGGTGTAFDWRILDGFPRRGRALFLAGGLTARTVGRAIDRVSPDWVDVSSSVESSPGTKDAAKMRSFVRAVKKQRSRS